MSGVRLWAVVIGSKLAASGSKECWVRCAPCAPESCGSLSLKSLGAPRAPRRQPQLITLGSQFHLLGRRQTCNVLEGTVVTLSAEPDDRCSM